MRASRTTCPPRVYFTHRKGQLRTRFVVKADVLGDDAPEVILTEDEEVVEQLSPERTGEASAKAFMSGARIAVRTTRTPGDLNTPAKRAPSFVSWSQMTTCGASSMVAFWPAARTTRRSAHTSPRHGGSFGDAGPGRRARTPRGIACRTSARSHRPTSRGSLGTSTSSARRLGVECGACTAESFACRRGCLA